jgi:peptide deformylase
MDVSFCYYGDEVLKKVSSEVTDFNSRLHELADALMETIKRKRGLGLASPQIGILKRLYLIDMTEAPEERKQLPKPLFLVNPRIVESTGAAVIEEGCLSFPGLHVELERAAKVRVEYQDLEGQAQVLEATGIVARAVQHELDHLDGILLLDRLTPLARMRLGKEVRRMRKIIEGFKEKGI